MNPRFSYGGGKIFTELMGIHFGKKYFKKLIIFRPHNVFGKNMGNEHVIPEFISRMKKNKSNYFFIKGSGKETRAFIHIDDFVKAALSDMVLHQLLILISEKIKKSSSTLAASDNDPYGDYESFNYSNNDLQYIELLCNAFNVVKPNK
jgi:dTDP-D-glucose 4,6-dehydratase